MEAATMLGGKDTCLGNHHFYGISLYALNFSLTNYFYTVVQQSLNIRSIHG